MYWERILEIDSTFTVLKVIKTTRVRVALAQVWFGASKNDENIQVSCMEIPQNIYFIIINQ